MKEITAMNVHTGNTDGYENTYYPVVNPDGTMNCSCGCALIKRDDETYECPGGYPIYRFSDGSLTIDKFGRIMMKQIPHEKR